MLIMAKNCRWHWTQGLEMILGLHKNLRRKQESRGGAEMLQWKQTVERLLLALKMDRGWAREMEKTGNRSFGTLPQESLTTPHSQSADMPREWRRCLWLFVIALRENGCNNLTVFSTVHWSLPQLSLLLGVGGRRSLGALWGCSWSFSEVNYS